MRGHLTSPSYALLLALLRLPLLRLALLRLLGPRRLPRMW